MSAPKPGRPWAPGDVLIRFLPPRFGVPPGWTMLSDDALYGQIVWQRAEQSGLGDPDVYVATPIGPGGGPDGTAVTWDGAQ
jgi:hypothetical protein